MRWIHCLTGGSLASIALVAFAPSCGGNNHGGGFAGLDGSVNGDGSSSGGSGSGGDEVGMFGGDDTGTSNCDLTCSADLHNVVDCNGNVKTMCPPDQGC